MKWIWILVATTAFAQEPVKQFIWDPAAEAMKQSIEQQKAAARMQAQLAGAAMVPWGEPKTVGAKPGDGHCEPIGEEELYSLIDATAKSHALKPKLLRALIKQESGFNPCALSSKGAQGLMQLMPETSALFGVTDPFNPKQNLDAGARYLKQLLNKYGNDVKLALGAYNAGSLAVDSAGHRVPNIPETRDYVASIMRMAQ